MIPNCYIPRAKGFLARLRQDSGGNTLALIAAGLVPLLALVGGGIDMGRSYLSQTRLQQACDAGVLAARKKLGSTVVADGIVPADVATIGNRFFNLNFQDGSYGTESREFEMTLEPDYAISGEAAVEVPATIMTLFGYDEMPISVTCAAQLNFSNTDIMFVLDSTKSMDETNPSDSLPRIEILRTVVKNFHTQLEGSKSPGTRVRYGFVPYSTNVNVGALLKDEWVVDDWAYQSRENQHSTTTTGTDSSSENWVHISGSQNYGITVSTYEATWNDPVPGTSTSSGGELGTTSGGGGSPGYYSCNGSSPADTFNADYTLLSSNTEPYEGPPSGDRVVERYRVVYQGDDYWTQLSGNTCTIVKTNYNSDTWEYDWVTVPDEDTDQFYRYASIPRNVLNWRTETNGCIEERATYEIDDWDNVDLTRALDLDIDTVPTAGDADTQWRPRYPDIIWERSLDDWDESDEFTVHPVIDDDDFFQPTSLPSLVACPTASQKLAEMDAAAVDAYLNSITPVGTTYHDIGMIWGGRLLSPTGLFADDNADGDAKPTSRHLIFLTDGKTETFDIAYGAYGVEPLDQRRWRSLEESGIGLDEVVEKRFSVACEEVKKRNITVWVIGFGVGLEEFMTNCAGPGHHFEAADAGELDDVFSKIAAQLGELRISK